MTKLSGFFTLCQLTTISIPLFIRKQALLVPTKIMVFIIEQYSESLLQLSYSFLLGHKLTNFPLKTG